MNFKVLGLTTTLLIGQQLPQPEPTVALIFGNEVEIIKLSDARAEHEALLGDETLKRAKHSRYVALVLALETVQGCEQQQADAGLCLMMPEQ